MSNIITKNMQEKLEAKVSTCSLIGGSRGYAASTASVTIPRNIAIAYKLDKPGNVIVTPTDKGVLITKLELPK